MNCSFSYILKAALISAAFLFLPVEAKTNLSSIDNIKQKVSQLLASKQKDQAIQLIINYSKTERSKAYKNEASELLFSIGQSFLTKEAQEEYEASLNDTLTNERQSLKAADRCLKLEPLNLDCLIQKARIQHRTKSEKSFQQTLLEIKQLLERSNYELIFQNILDRKNADFKNKLIVTVLPTLPTERTIIFVYLEIERSFAAKNFSRAKEIILYGEKYFSDWPDLAYFKNKLNNESTENLVKAEDDLMASYNNKCKIISKSVSRKYRYDFDLCNRG